VPWSNSLTRCSRVAIIFLLPHAVRMHVAEGHRRTSWQGLGAETNCNAKAEGWFSDTEKVRALLKMTFALQRSLVAPTFVQVTEIAYLSHNSWPHQLNLSHCFDFIFLSSLLSRWKLFCGVTITPCYVRFRATADKNCFWFSTVCPLMTQTGHSTRVKVDRRYRSQHSSILRTFARTVRRDEARSRWPLL
jgi:hypothetical protein